jgi:Armadillo/beta-catenin-like repeat
LTNITSGSSKEAKVVVKAGAVPGLISLLGSPHPKVADKAVLALGNISVDRPKMREHIIQEGIIEPLLLLIKVFLNSEPSSVSFTCYFSMLCILIFCSRSFS